MLLAIDASSKSTGIAIYDDKKNLIHYDCITSNSTDLMTRVKIMGNGIAEVLKQYPTIDRIVMEEVRPDGGLNMNTYKVLMYVQCAIRMAVHDFNKKIKIEFILPNSWRSKIGIKTGAGVKRMSLKERDIQYVADKYNIQVNDDIADAIGIGESQLFEVSNELNWE